MQLYLLIVKEAIRNTNELTSQKRTLKRKREEIWHKCITNTPKWRTMHFHTLQNIWLHSDYGPTYDGQWKAQQLSNQMYPPELEIKDTTESNTSASYLDLLLSIGRDGQLRTSLYDKRDDFNFHITNFPFLSSNIPSSPAYGVFISQLIRYARACSSYECFILRAMRLSNKLLGQGYVKERLNRLLGSSMVGTGILPNNMKSPSPEYYTTFWMMTTYSDTLHW